MTTALITGANRGIGLELARQLHARGVTVIGTARNPEAATELAAFATVEQCDVSTDESVDALAKRLEGTTIDLLINNAGILNWQDGIDTPGTEVLLNQFQVNAIGPFRVTRALLPNLKTSSEAKVANITSRMGSIADNTSGGHYGYRASKAALNIISVSLAKDIAPIPVAILHPGAVKTEMTGGHGDVTVEYSVERLLKLIDDLTPENSGTFWHRDGHILPW